MAPPALACEPALEAQVAAKPDDSDARDALARSCARAGEHAEALAHYDRLLALDGTNVDWLLGKSQALLALQRPREALPLLETARRRAPDYEDVWRANVNALDQLDEFDAADTLLADAAVQFPLATWPRERRAALAERRLLERGSRVFADLSYEELSGDRPAWKSASFGYMRPLGEARRVFAGLHLEERFDTRDEQFLAAWSDRLDDDWSYGLSADFSPDAEILPEWSVTAEAGRALPQDWSLGLRLRHASYADGRRRHARDLGREVPRGLQHRLHAQHREDLRHQQPELRSPAARRARVRRRQQHRARRRLRRGGRDRRARRRAGDRHEERRAARPALDEPRLGDPLGYRLVRAGGFLRPVPGAHWTRAPVLN